MILPVNYLAVVVAAIVAFVVGSLWYGPLFGKQWLTYQGRNPLEREGMGFPKKAMAIQIVASLVTAWVLAEFVGWLGVRTLEGGLVLGLWVWLGFYATTLVDGSLWYRQPWGVYWINLSQRLVSIVAMAVILGMWR